MKNPIVKNVLVIVLAALILFGLSFGLKGLAQSNADEVALATMQALLPGSEAFEVEPYTGEDANVVAVHKGQGGFVVETSTYGYAGYITMMVGVTDDGEVTGVVVKDMHETFGLGFNALNDVDFLGQFLYGEGTMKSAPMWTVSPAQLSRPRPSPAASIPLWLWSPARTPIPAPLPGEVKP